MGVNDEIPKETQAEMIKAMTEAMEDRILLDMLNALTEEIIRDLEDNKTSASFLIDPTWIECEDEG